MNLQQVKEILNKAGFSEESLKIMNELFDEAIKSGYLIQEAKNKLLGIIDIEIETAHLEADAMEDVALALENFASEIDQTVDKTEKDLQSIDNGLVSDVKEAISRQTTVSLQ